MKNSFDKKKTLNNNSLSQSNINIRINSNLRKSSNLSEGRYNNVEEFKKQNSLEFSSLLIISHLNPLLQFDLIEL